MSEQKGEFQSNQEKCSRSPLAVISASSNQATVNTGKKNWNTKKLVIFDEDKENWHDRAEIVTKNTHDAYNRYAKELLIELVEQVPAVTNSLSPLQKKVLIENDEDKKQQMYLHYASVASSSHLSLDVSPHISEDAPNQCVNSGVVNYAFKRIVDHYSDSEYESADEAEDGVRPSTGAALHMLTPTLSRTHDAFECSLLSSFEKMKLDESQIQYHDSSENLNYLNECKQQSDKQHSFVTDASSEEAQSKHHKLMQSSFCKVESIEATDNCVKVDIFGMMINKSETQKHEQLLELHQEQASHASKVDIAKIGEPYCIEVNMEEHVLENTKLMEPALNTSVKPVLVECGSEKLQQAESGPKQPFQELSCAERPVIDKSNTKRMTSAGQTVGSESCRTQMLQYSKFDAIKFEDNVDLILEEHPIRNVCLDADMDENLKLALIKDELQKTGMENAGLDELQENMNKKEFLESVFVRVQEPDAMLEEYDECDIEADKIKKTDDENTTLGEPEAEQSTGQHLEAQQMVYEPHVIKLGEHESELKLNDPEAVPMLTETDKMLIESAIEVELNNPVVEVILDLKKAQSSVADSQAEVMLEMPKPVIKSKDPVPEVKHAVLVAAEEPKIFLCETEHELKEVTVIQQDKEYEINQFKEPEFEIDRELTQILSMCEFTKAMPMREVHETNKTKMGNQEFLEIFLEGSNKEELKKTGSKANDIKQGESLSKETEQEDGRAGEKKLEVHEVEKRKRDEVEIGMKHLIEPDTKKMRVEDGKIKLTVLLTENSNQEVAHIKNITRALQLDKSQTKTLKTEMPDIDASNLESMAVKAILEDSNAEEALKNLETFSNNQNDPEIWQGHSVNEITVLEDSQVGKTVVEEAGNENTEFRKSVCEEAKLRKHEIEKVVLGEPEIERTVLKETETEKTVLEETGTEKTVLKEHETEKTVLKVPYTEKTVLKELEAEKTVLKERETEKTVLEETGTEKTVLKEPETEKTVLKEPETEKTVLKERETEKTVLEETGTEKTVLKEPETEKTMLKEPDTEKTVLKEPETEKTVLKEPETEKTVLKERETEKTVLKETEAEKTVLKEPVTEKTVLKECETEKTVLEETGTEKTVLKECETEKTVLEETGTEKTVLKERETEKTVLKEPVTEKAMLKENETKKTLVKEPDTEKTVLKERETEKTVLKEHKTEKTVLEQPATEKTVLEEPATEKTVLKEPETEKTVLEEPATEKTVLKEPETEKTVLKETGTEKTVLKEPVTEKAMLKENETKKTLVKEPDTEKTVLEECETEKTVLKERETEKTVLKERETEKTVLEEPVTEKAMLKENETKKTLVKEPDTEKTVLKERETEKTVLKERETEKTVLEEPATEKTVLEEPATEKTVLKEPETEKTVLKKPETEKTVLRETETEKAVLKEPETEKTVLKKPETEKTMLRETETEKAVLKEPETEKTVLKDRETEKTVLKDRETEKTVLKETGTEKTVLKETGTEKTMLKENETKKTLVKEPETEKTVLKERETEKTVLKKPETEKTVLRETETEKAVLKEPETEKTVLKENETKKTLVKEPDTEKTVLKERETEKTVLKERETEKTVLEEPATEKTVLEEPATEKTVLKEPETEKTVLKEPETEKAVLNDPETEKTVLKKRETEKTVLRETETEKAALKEPETEKTVLKDRETEKTVLKEAETKKTVLNEPGTEKTVLKKPETEKTVLRETETEKAVLKEPETEMTVLKEPGTEKTVLKEPETEKTVLKELETEKTVLKEPEAEKTVLKEPDTVKTVLKELETEETVLKELETEETVLKEIETGKTVLKEPETEKTVLKEPETEKTVLKETDKTMLKDPDTEKTALKEPEIEKTMLNETEKTVLKDPETEKTMLNETEKTVLKEPETEKSVLNEPEAEKTVLKEPETEKTMLNETEKTVLKEPETEKSVLNEPEAEKTVLKEPETEKTVLKEPETEKTVLKKPETEKSVLKEPETEKSVLNEPEAEKTVLKEPETEKSVLNEPEAEKTVLKEPDTVKTVLKELETEETVLKELETEKTLLKETETEKTVLKETETEKTMLTEPDTEKTVLKKSETEKTVLKETETEKTVVKENESKVEKTMLKEHDTKKTMFGEHEPEKTMSGKLEAKKTLLVVHEIEKAQFDKIGLNNFEIHNVEPSSIPFTSMADLKTEDANTLKRNLLDSDHALVPATASDGSNRDRLIALHDNMNRQKTDDITMIHNEITCNKSPDCDETIISSAEAGKGFVSEVLEMPLKNNFTPDFLDRLDDPEFNPFVTKSAVANSPCDDGRYQVSSENNSHSENKCYKQNDTLNYSHIPDALSNENKHVDDMNIERSMLMTSEECTNTETDDTNNTTLKNEDGKDLLSRTVVFFDPAQLTDPAFDPFTSKSSVMNSPPGGVSNARQVLKTPTLPGRHRQLQQLQRDAGCLHPAYDSLRTNSPISLANLASASNIDEFTSTREDIDSELTTILSGSNSEGGNRKMRQSLTSLEFDEITSSALALVNRVTPESSECRRRPERTPPNASTHTPSALHATPDAFTDASRFFSNPQDLDELAGHGAAASSNRLNLVRNSLYVKFDPLVSGRPSLAPLLHQYKLQQQVEEEELEEENALRRQSGLISFSPSPQKATDTTHSLLDTSVLDSTDVNATIIGNPNAVAVAVASPASCSRCASEGTWLLETDHKRLLKTELKSLELSLEARHLRRVRELEQQLAIATRQLEEQSLACQELQEGNAELTTTLKQLQVVVGKIVQQKAVLEKEHQQQLDTQQQEYEARLQRAATEATAQQDECNKLEVTFFDHVQKYQRLRDVVTTLHTNETKLKLQVSDLQSKLKNKGDQVKELLQTVEEKFKRAEEEAKAERQSHDQEKNKTAVMLKRAELRIASLQDAVNKEKAEKEEISALLDHLTQAGQ